MDDGLHNCGDVHIVNAWVDAGAGMCMRKCALLPSLPPHIPASSHAPTHPHAHSLTHPCTHAPTRSLTHSLPRMYIAERDVSSQVGERQVREFLLHWTSRSPTSMSLTMITSWPTFRPIVSAALPMSTRDTKMPWSFGGGRWKG